MEDAKQQLADKLKNANNILVTVSRDPSVDQLAACLGLTLLLNKLNKHAAAVFSGQVPSTLEFLQPEDTLEKNTDSLRDFIIALDKSKADKLRYKVEDNIVRIFITPYRTSITQDDLQFSQGDFNVDVVVALGVHSQTDLDEAITAHGRILHDATVATINLSNQADLGGINWTDPTASSLSELVTELAQAVDKELIDGQIATALLTGIVAETNRFSNEKTTSQTMSVSAALMSAGANQQLVATKLGEGSPAAPAVAATTPADTPAPAAKAEPGTLEISHQELPSPSDEPLEEIPEDATHDEPDEPPAPPLPAPEPPADTQPPEPANDHLVSGSRLITEPPTMGGTLSANVRPEALDPVTDPLSLPTENKGPILSRDAPSEPAPPPPPKAKAPKIEPLKEAEEPAPEPEPAPAPPAPEPPVVPEPEPPTPPPAPTPAPPSTPVAGLTPPPPAWVPPSEPPAEDKSSQTLSDLEKSVHSTHTDAVALDQARDEVTKAFNESPATPAVEAPAADAANPTEGSVAFDPAKFGITSDPTPPSADNATVTDPNAPPPVPPPIPFQFGNPNNPPQ